ncbi:DUF3237 domain-containing protein [Belnapia sp. F-4-1]|uniref:DUF3237 domain-containing protein n=1 Tax=Belnapia sp. F-4-1 TaxID=1545443 RepID=UPI0005BDDABC|nr:DUF3237 domain-containing protein [Belnapia sp. F-4-1]
MELKHEFMLSARLEPPLAFGAGLRGDRIFFHAFDGRVEGERLHGTLLPGGGDWLIAHPSGWGILDVRTQIRTDDGALIYAHYPGLIEMDTAFAAAFANGTATRFEDQYFRTTPRMETGDPRYAWVNHSLFVGEGRVIEGLGVEYHVSRVT